MASGISRKGAERSKPKTENINEETNTPREKASRLGKGENGNMIIVYTSERNAPKKKPARVFPKIIENRDMGAVRSILNVPVLRSNGRDTA
jgi:hypothetical protein